MMQPIPVEFGEWLPDLPAKDNPGAIIARNVLPQIKSYRSLKDISTFTDALTNACLGFVWGHDISNAVYNFAGDVTKLYRLDGGNAWTDVSGVSGPYSATNWEFAEFGGHRMIAAADNNPLQKYDMGSDSAFADLAGSPPQAARIATVRDFVMLGDIAGLGPNYLQWCGFNNSELWTPSLATQADFQELKGRAGAVQRIVPGEYAVIFTEQSIFRADYAGPPVVFQIDEVERKRGTPAPGSVVWAGERVWYYGHDHFYFFNGQFSEPISNNRVSKWFAANAAVDGLDHLRGALDRRNSLVMWAFRTSNSLAYNNRLIIYNWAADKWSYAEVDTEIIEEYVSPGFSLDALDTPLPAGIDTDSILIDSDQYAGGALNVIAFDSTHLGGTFDGLPLTATIDTRELASADGKRLVVNRLRPLIEGTGGAMTITAQAGTRNNLGDNVIFDTAKGTNGLNGEITIRKNARYHRYRFLIAGGFDHANGAEVFGRPSGGRR